MLEICYCAHALCITQGMVGIDVVNCATKYTTEMRAKVWYFDHIKFNELVLKPGTVVYRYNNNNNNN